MPDTICKASGALCGANCDACPTRATCPGCAETNGCPYGKPCFLATYILKGGFAQYQVFLQELIEEINALKLPGMEPVTALYPLVGSFVNLEYPIPSGTVKLLKDDEVYLGAQVKNLFDDSGKTCFGVIARESFILICTYSENGTDSELILYKRR